MTSPITSDVLLIDNATRTVTEEAVRSETKTDNIAKATMMKKGCQREEKATL